MIAKAPILEFKGKYSFLSNFFACAVPFEGIDYPSSEHAFQAAKSLRSEQRERVRACPSPGAAKRLGHKLELREDWEEVKVLIMYRIVRNKFSLNSYLGSQLRGTVGRMLYEGNTWGDRFWGCVPDTKNVYTGENWLGRILMMVRDDIQ